MFKLPTRDQLEGRLFIGGAIAIILIGVYIIHTLAVFNLSEDSAQRVAEEAGLLSVEVSWPRMKVLFDGCPSDHLAYRKVSGLNAEGIRVDAVVCGGPLTSPLLVMQ